MFQEAEYIGIRILMKHRPISVYLASTMLNKIGSETELLP